MQRQRSGPGGGRLGAGQAQNHVNLEPVDASTLDELVTAVRHRIELDRPAQPDPGRQSVERRRSVVAHPREAPVRITLTISMIQVVVTDRAQPAAPPLCRRALPHRPDFDGARAGQRNSCGEGDGFVEILDVDEHVAAELLAGLRERTVGHQPLTIAHPDAGRR